MYLKLFVCLCACFLFSCVESQRSWGSSGGFSNSWNSNSGFSSNNRPSSGNSASWGSNSFGFGGRPKEQNSNWGYETSSNSEKNTGWNKGVEAEVIGGFSSGKQNEKKLSSITNLPNSSQGNTNSNNFQPNGNNNLGYSSWGTSNNAQSSQSNSQTSKQEEWYSNNYIGNQPKENEIPTEDNSRNPTNNKKKNKQTSSSSSSYGISGNSESTTQKNSKNPGNQKWETSSGNNVQQKPQGSFQTGKEKLPENTNQQKEKQSTLDTSILDELDKNDWYFGRESDYPKPPFRSTLNIDVSQLWNFDKSKNPKQNSNANSNNNNKNNKNSNSNVNDLNKNNNKNKNNKSNTNKNDNRRWNRGTEDGWTRIQCECVNVNLCEEEDIIMTQEDVQFDSRPLEEFRCEKLTDVCCTNPKLRLSNRNNIYETKEILGCGERKPGQKPFPGLGDDVAQPGEFPWSLRLENAEINCSASLIHHKMALTAAHCIAGAVPGELILKAGIWNSKGEPSQSRKVRKIIPHPDYSSRNPRNDIALLIPDSAFELTENVNTICLPVTNDKWDSGECVVAGWTSEEIHGQVLEVFEKGVVNFLPQSECQNIMLVTDLWRNYILHESFVCGLEKTGRKSCTGDEGGFVVCPSKKKANTYIQIGIVSKGMGCDEFGRPGIFTNVLTFLDWINKTYFELGLFDEIDIRSLSK